MRREANRFFSQIKQKKKYWSTVWPVMLYEREMNRLRKRNGHIKKTEKEKVRVLCESNLQMGNYER